ncbi:MAG: SpoVG family protein [Waddliaceae bacterium]
MEITEINISLRNEDKLKAFVNVTFDDAFVVRGMKVIKGSTGFFISMPSRKMPDGSYRDIAHPIRNEFRQYIENEILAEYRKSLEQEGGEVSEHVDTAVEEG